MGEFICGVILAVAAFFVLGVIAIPQWEDRIVSAKVEACQLLDSKFVAGESKFSLGHCENGNAITYRFKK